MKKRFNLATVLVLMALMAVVTTVIVNSYVYKDMNNSLEIYSRQSEELRALLELKDDIESKYVGEYDMDVILQGAMTGMVENLGDVWSHYWTPEAFAAYNKARQNNEVSIGIDVTPDAENQGMQIVKINEGSSAGKAGLMIGDVITEVDGQPVADMTIETFAGMLYGEEYTAVTMTVWRESDDTKRTFQVLRETIAREVVSSKILGTVGYVRIENFDSRVDDDCIAAVNELIESNVKGLVFDVRNNPGGSLDVMHKILDYLLDDQGPAGGTLITLRNKNDKEKVYYSDAACVRLPMAVLINGNSYSAAEFFAACLQEYEWAALVGEKTGGKGYAQEIFRLDDGSGLLLSTKEYYTPSGKSLAGVGVQPDIELVLTPEEEKQVGSLEPEQDKQLQKALQHLGAIS